MCNNKQNEELQDALATLSQIDEVYILKIRDGEWSKTFSRDFLSQKMPFSASFCFDSNAFYLYSDIPITRGDKLNVLSEYCNRYEDMSLNEVNSIVGE